MTDTFFEVDAETAAALNQGMNLRTNIELPFKAPVFWWRNGAANMRALANQAPALFFGGWETDQEVFDEATQEYGAYNNETWAACDMTSKDGKDYTAYTVRGLVVAPISYRAAWFIKDRATGVTTRFTDWVAGARHQTQMLALLGHKNEEGMNIPWGPVVLSAKGYQAQYLLKAAKDWAKIIQKGRNQYAPQVPVWGFWMALGTWGNQPIIEMAGKAGAQSPITPIKLAAAPATIDVDFLKRLFVGRDGLTLMRYHLEEAKEWLDAWKQGTATVQNGNGIEPPVVDDVQPPDDTNGNDVPF
jgi:hypothetical protein